MGEDRKKHKYKFCILENRGIDGEDVQKEEEWVQS